MSIDGGKGMSLADFRRGRLVLQCFGSLPSGGGAEEGGVRKNMR